MQSTVRGTGKNLYLRMQKGNMRNRLKQLLYRCRFLLSHIRTFCAVRLVPALQPEKQTGILLIRNDALGDFLVTLAVMEQIYGFAQKNGLKVSIAVSETMRELAEKCPFFDEVISIPQYHAMRKFGVRSAVLRRFAAMRAEILINFPVFGRFMLEDHIACFARAKQKAALKNDTKIFSLYAACFQNRIQSVYTDIVPYDWNKTLLENEAALASRVLNTEIIPELGNPDFLRPLPEPQCGSPYYLIVPGSANPRRRWEPEKFAQVIDSIAEKCPDLIPVLSGSAGDSDAVRQVLACSANREKIRDLCGKSSLLQLFGNVDKAEFILTNDTGTLHLAALLRKTAFCVHGLGHFGAYVPNPYYKTVTYFSGTCNRSCCGWLCSRKEEGIYPCISGADAKTVADRIEDFLKSR